MRVSSIKIRESFNYEVNHRVRIRVINLALLVTGVIFYISFL